jgi:cytochrome c553
VGAGRFSALQLLRERQATHGDFSQVARIAQGIKELLRSGPAWARMTAEEREVLESSAVKQARAACGDCHHVDTWRDMSGYPQLVVEFLEGRKIAELA